MPSYILPQKTYNPQSTCHQRRSHSPLASSLGAWMSIWIRFLCCTQLSLELSTQQRYKYVTLFMDKYKKYLHINVFQPLFCENKITVSLKWILRGIHDITPNQAPIPLLTALLFLAFFAYPIMSPFCIQYMNSLIGT